MGSMPYSTKTAMLRYLTHRKLERKRKGLCIRCGRPRGRRATVNHCRACADHISQRSSDFQKRQRRQRKLLSICQRCASNIGKHGTSVLCRSCADLVYRRHTKMRNHKALRGVCRICDRRVLTGRKRCRFHLTIAAGQALNRYHRRIAQGRCAVCGNSRRESPSKRLCRKHYLIQLRRVRDWRRQRTSRGICVDCGRYTFSKYRWCDRCRKHHYRTSAKKVSERSRAGQCVVCRRPKLPKTRLCLKHWLQGISRTALKTSKEWEFLLEKYQEQQGRCPYTGRKIFFGCDAGLDHILPRSKYPKIRYSKKNVQWVYQPVNTMKWNMSESEFLHLVRQITRHRHLV